VVHDAPEASGAGFDGFISKPFDPDELVAAVSRLAATGRAPKRRP
jgi:DNA-binding NarL/FixJ family response regulator